MNLAWRKRRRGESWEVWRERVGEVRVTKREAVTGEGDYPGWGGDSQGGG